MAESGSVDHPVRPRVGDIRASQAAASTTFSTGSVVFSDWIDSDVGIGLPSCLASLFGWPVDAGEDLLCTVRLSKALLASLYGLCRIQIST